ncbi:MAG: carboxypeptidase-like regulatory domain-containing protein, partial [Flavobacteriales bacterium]
MSNEMQSARVRECEPRCVSGARVREGEGVRVRPLSLPLTLALFLFLPTLLRAQEVIITLNIIPPYSAYVYDYADLSGQAVITLTNTTQELKQVRLEGNLTNATADLFVRTEPGHRGASPIVIPPGGSVVLSTQPGVMEFLAPENVTTNANDQIQQAIVLTGQLPEGLYRLCVEAYDYNGPQLLSQPGGGCFSFGLYYANPPIITQPVNAAELNAYMTNPVFSWTPPLGNLAGALIEYDLLVTPVFAGQNPNDAIIAARTYRRGQPILVKEGLMTNVYVRQVFDLAFEQGKQYAMQVTASDRNGNVGISNQGRSEISVFTVGTVDTPVIPYGGTAPSGPIIDPGISPAFLANTLTGKLNYFWHNASNHGATASSGSGGSANIGAIGQMGSGSVQNTLLNEGNRTGYGDFTQAPLAGVTVQLIQAIQFQGTPAMGGIAPALLPGNIMMPSGSSVYVQGQTNMSVPVLATATTDAQGNFVFNVPHVQQLDFSWKQGAVSNIGSFSTAEFNDSYSGTFRRVLMVRVGNPARTYYAQPVQFSASLPANGDLGLFHAQVKSLDMKVRVAQRDDFSVKKDGLEVLLLRKVGSKPSLVPADEASRGIPSADPTITIEGQTYVELARDTSDAQGMAEFRDLVRFDCAVSANNLYYVWARPTDEFETRHSLVNLPQAVVYAYESDWTSACFDYHGNRLRESCMRCDLASRDGFGTTSRAHSRAYNGQDQWLYHIQRTVLRNPAVTATVRNSVGGTQVDLATAEPNAPWKLWRISKQGMEILRNGNTSWGAMLEANQPNGFIMATNALVSQGHMVMHASGVTGNDGRIHRKELPVQKEGTVPVGYYYVLDVDKPGFRRTIKVVRRINLGGGTLNTGVIGQINPNTLNLLGGASSGSGSTGSSSTNSSEPNSGDVSMLRLGYQYSAGEIFIAPRGQVKVVLMNEAGTTIPAKANYRDPSTGQEGMITASTWNMITSRREVLLSVPSGNGMQIIIIPNDLETYDRDTITVNVPATGTLTTTAIIPYKIHRIHFVLRGEPNEPQLVQVGQDPQAIGLRLVNARVELMAANPVMYPAIKHTATSPGGAAASVAGQPLVRTTDSQGRVDFAFRASGGSFTFRFYAPDGSSYVTREVSVSSNPGKHWQVKNVQLERGRTVRGTVTIDSAAVANAKVRYTYMDIIAEATTNAAGEYVLYNVPRSQLEFQAMKQGYLGMEYNEATGNSNSFGTIATTTISNYDGNVAETIIDFQLRVYGGMDFSRILGFPLEVTAFAEEPDGKARINGWVTVPDSANAVFRMTQTSASGDQLRCVRFLNTVVEPDVLMEAGIPLTKPSNLPMSLAVNQVPVGLYPQQGEEPYVYHATLRDTQQGIALDRPA